MTVDATLFCNGATPERKYHAVADTAHGVHVSCLGFEKAYVSVEDLSERRGTVWATPTVGPPPCRGAVRGRGHPLSRFPRNSCEVGNRLQDS